MIEGPHCNCEVSTIGGNFEAFRILEKNPKNLSIFSSAISTSGGKKRLARNLFTYQKFTISIQSTLIKLDTDKKMLNI